MKALINDKLTNNKEIVTCNVNFKLHCGNMLTHQFCYRWRYLLKQLLARKSVAV